MKNFGNGSVLSDTMDIVGGFAAEVLPLRDWCRRRAAGFWSMPGPGAARFTSRHGPRARSPQFNRAFDTPPSPPPRNGKRERIYQGTNNVASISIGLRDPVP